MLQSARRRWFTGAAIVAIGAIVLTACASQREDDGGDDASNDVDSTFVFGASGDPASLDPAFASDGETFRVARQMFEGLVGTVPGTADPAPLLAKSWDQPDDTTYVFELQEGVTFHDGTEFNAEAVCYNFDRQNAFTGLAASQSMAYYWGVIMRGFGADSIYDSCTADSDLQATITLTQPFAGFVPALSLPSFSIQSPTALQEYGADDVTGTEDAPIQSEYGQGHPTGTGPFVFDSISLGEQTILKAYPEYWGEQGVVDEIIFRVIGDTTARRQALEAGSIDGYDLVAPADLQSLEGDGFTLVNREPFNVLYLGMNQSKPGATEGTTEPSVLADLKVRQAIAHAIDRNALITQVLPEGTEAATQFMPPAVIGWNDSVTEYEYNPETAMALLAEAGYDEANPLTITFNYPVNISRPYMPNPEQIFTNLSSQLEAVGIEINPVTNEWVEYLDLMQGGSEHGIHLLGWTGDYNDPDNFVGTFFGLQTNEWGFDNPELFSALSEARGLATEEEQEAAYLAINEQIMQFLPGVPLAHPVPTLAFDPRVESYPASPVQDEVYNLIELNE